MATKIVLVPQNGSESNGIAELGDAKNTSFDPVYIHPTALVDTHDIGQGTRIWAFSHIMDNVRVGAHCNIGEHCFVEAGALIGNNVTVKNGNQIWEGIRLRDGVFVGPQVTFTNDRYPRSPRLYAAAKRYIDRSWLLMTTVEQGASVGGGAVILPGVTIGEFSTVAAGAIVTRDVCPHSLVVGTPARHTGWVCCCGDRLFFRSRFATCRTCGARFRQGPTAATPTKHIGSY